MKMLRPLITLLACASGASQAPTQLRVDAREAPVLGVETRRPLFQWAAPAGQKLQAAAQIRVVAHPEERLVWDSGVINSSALTAAYAGSALEPMTAYAFTVRSWDAFNASATPEYSAPGLFVTGVWGNWSATPIWHTNSSASFTFLRSESRLPSASAPLASAFAFVTANPQPSTQGEVENAKLLAAYRLYVDAEWVGLGPGRPGSCGPVCPLQGDPLPCPCTPHHWYDTYNVTDLVAAVIARGANLTLALQNFNYPPTPHSAVLNQTSQVLLQVALTYADGSRALVGGTGSAPWSAFNADPVYNPTCCTSDTSWFLQPAENFDARLEPVGWRSAGYAPEPPLWTPAADTAGWGAVPLQARATRPMAITTGLVPASAVVLGPGHVFVDLGKEIQGGLSIAFPASSSAGLQVSVRLGEELLSTSPPAVMYDMRTGNKYISTWTLRGGAQRIEHHEYMEFRYVELVAVLPEQCVRTVAADYTTPVVLSCPADQTISVVEFASWGTPSGACTGAGAANTFAINASCAFAGTEEVVAGLCVGHPSCTFVPSDALFGGVDPCDKVEKWLAVAVNCSGVGGAAGSSFDLQSWAADVNVTAWQLMYPAAYVADQVETSSPELNAVWELCQYTVVATALDVYTDSNTRQRSVICMEALTINLLMQYATSTETALQEHTLLYAMNGRPSGMGWAEWQALTIYSVYWVYLYTGDLSVFNNSYAELRRFTELSLVNVSGTGLWTCDGKSFYCTHPEIDWPSGMRDGFVFVPADTVVNAYTALAMELFATMASAAGGHDDDAALFAAAAPALRAAINARLYNASCGCYEDGLGAGHSAWHSSVYALAFGVPTPDIAPAVYAHVVAGSVAQPELCQPGNVYPAQWALEALYSNTSDHGHNGLTFLTCTGINGWLAQLRQGATTTMEAWNATEKPNLTWSHPWAASPADIILRWLLGIRPLVPGFAHLVIQPQLGTLTSARGTLPTLRGVIAVSVNQTLTRGLGSDVGSRLGPASMEIIFSVPGSSTARVCLPLSACGAAGFVLVDGARVAGVVDGDYVCVDPVFAGAHTAACPAPGDVVEL